MPDENRPAGDHRFAINYIKSGLYRDVTCDGAFGGPTPSGKLWLGLYSERAPIPRVMVYPARVNPADEALVTVDETAVPEFVESRAGIVRNVEVGAFLSLDVVRRLHKWLGDKINELETLQDPDKAPRP